MPIIPFWYTMTEIERRAMFYFEAYERARNSQYISAAYRNQLFENYCFWRNKVER